MAKVENNLVVKLKKSSWSSIAKETIAEIERLEADNESLRQEDNRNKAKLAAMQNEVADLTARIQKIKGLM